MYHYGATINFQLDDPRGEELWGRLMPAACEAFGLCVSAGCGCKVEGAKKICNEVYNGTRLKVAASEGPTWLIIAYKLPNSVSFDFFFDEETPPRYDSKVAFVRSLRDLDLPIFIRETTSHYSQEKRGHGV